MTVESEMLVERRQTGQRLTLWRMVAVMMGLLLLLVLVVRGGTGETGSKNQDHVARVEIDGIIGDDAKQQKLLKDLKKADQVKAVVLRIDSPGGTTTGGEALYLHIRELAEKKPVVAVFGTVAASAAYMAGIGADYIVTRGSTITGSVGVIMYLPDVSEMMAKLGISVEELKSGTLKAAPSPFKQDSPEELAPMRELVADTYDWFINLVVERRKIKLEEVPGLSQGRVYSGRQALKFGLVDAIGGEDEAIKWLVKEKNIDKDLPVLKRAPKSENSFGFVAAFSHKVLKSFGLDGLAAFFLGTHNGRSLEPGLGSISSQGLMSIWTATPSVR